MIGNDAKALLDLNFPDFQADLFDLDVSEIKKVFKALKKIKALTWNEVFRDKGLHWEAVRSMPGVYTVRLSQSYRAVVAREGRYMQFTSLYPDHDGAYGKK